MPERERRQTAGAVALREVLLARDISLRAADRELGISSGTCSRLVSSRRLPGRTLSQLVLDLYGIDPVLWDVPATRN